MFDLSILIIGYDGYSDLWDDCIQLIKRFWPDCPFEIIFVNNEKKIEYENIKLINAGAAAEWSQKVNLALKNISTKYVCLLIEDFFVGDKIDNQKVFELIQLIKDNNINYAKLVDMNDASKCRNKNFCNIKGIKRIKYNDEYGISLQPSIWNVDFLEEKLGNGNYNAWKFEFARVKECNYKDGSYRPDCIYDTRNILNIKHGVIQGEYLPTTIKYFKKRNIQLHVDRKIMSSFKYKKIRYISWTKGILPKFTHRILKRILEKLGMKFVSTKRDV